MLLNDLDIKRFNEKTYRDEQGVLRWSGGKSGNGYGLFSVNGKARTAHSVAWIIEHGPLPEGWRVSFAEGVDRDVVDTRFLVAGPRKASKVDEASIADDVMADTRSQETIADAFGISRDAVRRIQNGRYSGGAYKDREVQKVVENYLEIKSMMLPRGSLRNDTEYTASQLTEQSGNGLYRRSSHVHTKASQNSRSRTEDLFVASIDLEEALKTLCDDDYALVLGVCILQTMDHDEAARHFNYSNGDSVRSVIKRIVTKLRRAMNGET